jgi:sugar lactone lactonase YvrE
MPRLTLAGPAAITALVLLLAALMLLAAPPRAAATGEVRTIVAFDAASGQNPEGVAVDRTGNVFVSFASLGQLARVEPGAAEAEPFGSVPGIDPLAGDLGLLGLALGPGGDVYGAVVSKAAGGIWRFDHRTGEAERLPGTEAIPFPNGIAFDPDGDLYVASSAEGASPAGALQGAIWRVARDGSVERLLVHDALGGLGALVPIGVGANGIGWRDGVLYVTNTEKGLLITIDVGRGGALGAPQVVASGPSLHGADGLALDRRGNVYVAVIEQSTVERVDPDGAIDLVADAAGGLDWASSLAFDPRRGGCRTLYAVNFAIGAMFGFPPGAGPALLRIDL